MKKKTQEEFLIKVFPEELEEIAKRRKNAQLDKGELSASPSTDNLLTGLALSGGGIRSATFGLALSGGLQIMACSAMSIIFLLCQAVDIPAPA